MSARWLIIYLILLALLVSAIWATPGKASLNSDYPTDSFGRVEVPAIEALATSVIGFYVPTYCAPTSKDAYGWVSDRNDPETLTTDDYDQVDWSNVSINISGDICQELERLTRFPESKRFFRKPCYCNHAWPNEHIYYGGVAILTLVHESLHVKLQSADEGWVECSAVHNLWPTVSALHLPVYLNKLLLFDALDDHLQAPDEYLTVC